MIGWRMWLRAWVPARIGGRLWPDSGDINEAYYMAREPEDSKREVVDYQRFRARDFRRPPPPGYAVPDEEDLRLMGIKKQ